MAHIVSIIMIIQSIWFPLVIKDFSPPPCQVLPTINNYAIPAEGLTVRVTRIPGCTVSEIGMRITYIDENGNFHNTYDIPIEADREYYIPQWQAWEINNTVRFNVSVRVRCIDCVITVRNGI